jgi:Protein of unknown function (DUF3995)
MMARVVGIVAAAVLLGLGALHVYWAGGGRWGTDVTVPTRDGNRAFVPSSAATLMVAMLLFAASLVMLGRLGLWGQWLPRWPFVAGAWTLVVVFGARVVGDLRWFGLFKRTTGTQFSCWDNWLYVPLSGLLALAALLVARSAR